MEWPYNIIDGSPDSNVVNGSEEFQRVLSVLCQTILKIRDADSSFMTWIRELIRNVALTPKFPYDDFVLIGWITSPKHHFRTKRMNEMFFYINCGSMERYQSEIKQELWISNAFLGFGSSRVLKFWFLSRWSCECNKLRTFRKLELRSISITLIPTWNFHFFSYSTPYYVSFLFEKSFFRIFKLNCEKYFLISKFRCGKTFKLIGSFFW
jgi:hypothetical protein